MICIVCKTETDIKSNKWVEPVCLSCEAMFAESDRLHMEFSKKYKQLHEACPKCGDTNYTSTLAGYAYDSDNPDGYKDLNDCVCYNCGDKHVVHDRVQKTNS
jgi:predicted nucleic-acid-binding Zn-ribbon protein